MVKFNWESYKLDGVEESKFNELLKASRDDLRDTFIKTESELQKMIDLVKPVILDAENKNWRDIREIWNTIGHILYISYDLKVVSRELCEINNSASDKMLLRFGCTHLYESMQNIVNLLGSNFSKEIYQMGVKQDILTELSEIRGKLQKFKEVHREDFDLVRNSIGSHRDKDFIVFDDIYRSLEKIPIMRIIIEFDNLLNEAGEIVAKIMDITMKIKTGKVI